MKANALVGKTVDTAELNRNTQTLMINFTDGSYLIVSGEYCYGINACVGRDDEEPVELEHD